MAVIDVLQSAIDSVKALPENQRVNLLAEKLRQTLETSTVLTPDTEGYAESIRRWSDAAERQAGIVVYVGSAEDISQALRLAQGYSVSFAVCGGKHSSGGASSSTGGLVIDLGKMRAVQVDTQTNTIRVQGGCIWQDVDLAASKFGLAMVGGTVNHTGVGGLTLGGGYGWLSGRYGLTIDSLLSVKMVLADGRIVNVSKNEYPDLFWAVRGAGQCFGVAAEFTFQAYPQDSVWAGQLVFPADAYLEAVLDFANNLADRDADSALIMGITQPPISQDLVVIANVFHNGTESAALKVFQPLLNLKPILNTAKFRPYREVNAMMNHAVDYGGRKLSKGASFSTPLSAMFVRLLMKELTVLHLRVPSSKKSIMLFEFFHTAKLNNVPFDEMAFANRGQHQNFMCGPFWDFAEDDNYIRTWARDIAKLARMELERVNQASGGINEYGKSLS